MAGNYSPNSRAIGELLTAAKYNADAAVHRDNMTPAGVDDYSVSVGQMQTVTDPGEFGSESLPTSAAGEFERYRFSLAEVKGPGFHWYETTFGVHDRQAAQTATTNTTSTTAVYSIAMQNFFATKKGFTLRTLFDVLQNTGSPQNITIDARFGGQTIASKVVALADSATKYAFVVHARISARNATNAQIGFLELFADGDTYKCGGNPAMTVDTTLSQTLEVRFTMGVANANFTVTHGHSFLLRD